MPIQSSKSSQERKNVLVTGGAGFIGSHLCERLVKKNNVICVDNFSSGKETNIDHLLRLPTFEFIRHDLVQPIDLEQFPELRPFKVPYQGIQQVYHLACPTSHKEIEKYTVETALANSHGTYHALSIAAKYKARFLLGSTASIYGNPLEGQNFFPEKYWGFVDPIGPRSPYYIGKRYAEMLTKAMGERHQIDVKIARIFNTYGPRMMLKDGRKIPDIIEAAATDAEIKIYGDGNETNSYCFVDDMVDGLMRLMKSDVKDPMNLGNPQEYSDQDVANKVIELTESKSTILFRDELPYITKPALPNIQFAQTALNWFPVVQFDVGLKKTIEYHLGRRQLVQYKHQSSNDPAQ